MSEIKVPNEGLSEDFSKVSVHYALPVEALKLLRAVANDADVRRKCVEGSPRKLLEALKGALDEQENTLLFDCLKAPGVIGGIIGNGHQDREEQLAEIVVGLKFSPQEWGEILKVKGTFLALSKPHCLSSKGVMLMVSEFSAENRNVCVELMSSPVVAQAMVFADVGVFIDMFGQCEAMEERVSILKTPGVLSLLSEMEVLGQALSSFEDEKLTKAQYEEIERGAMLFEGRQSVYSMLKKVLASDVSAPLPAPPVFPVWSIHEVRKS